MITLPLIYTPPEPWMNLDLRRRTAMHQVNFDSRNQRQKRKDNRRKMAAGFKKF